MTKEEFLTRFQLQLDPQQLAAMEHTQGPVLLLAVPGSGKTTTLIARLGYMIYCQDIPPENILTVTYTVAATRDMRERFSRTFGDEFARRLTFRTINGLCAVVVQHYAAWKGVQPFSLAAEDRDLNAVIRQLLQQSGIPFPGDQQIKEVRANITYCKNMMLTPEEIEEHQLPNLDFHKVYQGYQAHLRDNRLMDYDDQMVFTYRIFRQFPELLARFRRRYPYLCVDEAQDTSKIQHAILRLLAAPANNLFMVGDEDQSIYGFRAAWPKALLNFEQSYPGAQVLLMQTNYRSTASIVACADTFIQRNQLRRPKHMTTPNPQGDPIQQVMIGDYAKQYDYLLNIARSCTRSTAVLFRNNDSAIPLIDLLEREGLPYRVRQREAFFFTSPLVREITDILEFALDPRDSERFLKFYYKFDFKVKKPLISGILHGKSPDESVFTRLFRSPSLEGWQYNKARALQASFTKLAALDSYAALKYLLHDMEYQSILEDQRGDKARMDILLALARQNPDLNNLLARLRQLRQAVETPTPHPDCPFILSTVHSSKGLEYDRVILMDVLDGLFPSQVCTPEEEELLDEEEQEAMEEERRLFYVAATRAKHRLELLTYTSKFGSPAPKSTFAEQLLGTWKPPQPPRKKHILQPIHASATPASLEKDYRPGILVEHRQFGQGRLDSRMGSIAVIDFGRNGLKKLDIPTCLRSGLLKLV